MTKRILSLVLAALTVLSLCVPAFASGEPAVEDMPAVETPTEDAPVIEDTIEPEVTVEQAATAEPEIPAEPVDTGEPEATTEPVDTPEPEPADQPEKTAVIASGNCGAQGDNVKWSLSGDGTLTISGTGRMIREAGGGVGSADVPWDDYRGSIRKVVFSGSVSNIWGSAFWNCPLLTEITVPASVTEIDQMAFYFSDNLRAIYVDTNNPVYTSVDGVVYSKDKTMVEVIPKGITGSFTIPSETNNIRGNGMFNGLHNLTAIYVEDGNHVFFSTDGVLFSRMDLATSYVQTVLCAYPTGRCGASYSVPEGTKTLAWDAFAENQNLTSITLPESLNWIRDDAFCDCTNLSKINLPSYLKSIGMNAFLDCKSLTNITVPASVTYIGSDAFAYCEKLGTITVLSPDCEYQYFDSDSLPNRSLGIPGSTVVYGYDASTTEAFAHKFGYTFKSLGAVPTKKDGIITENGKTYFYVDGVKQVGKLVTTQDGKMYYCAPNDGHIMKGGVKKVNGLFCYLSPTDGHVVKGGWIAVGGKNKYYAGKDGVLYTGYCTIGSKSYYFSVKDAHLMKGGLVTGPGGKQYYVSANDGHAMKGGWARGLKVKGRTGYSYYYYLDTAGVVRMTQELPTSTKIASLAIPKPSEYQK